jgi:hypothetical protein
MKGRVQSSVLATLCHLVVAQASTAAPGAAAVLVRLVVVVVCSHLQVCMYLTSARRDMVRRGLYLPQQLQTLTLAWVMNL